MQLFTRLARSYYHHKLRNQVLNFKDLHLNKKCLIVGNGPSVNMNDLNKISDFVTFSCNRFHLAYKDTTFRPTYTCVSDNLMIADFGLEIIKESNNKIFLTDPVLANKYRDVYSVRDKPGKFFFEENILKGVNPSGSVLIYSIQIARYMGIKRIYLYGVDHKFNFDKTSNKTSTVTGEGNHFIKNYRSGKKWYPPKTVQIEEGLKICDRYLRKENGFIKNCSRSSHLTGCMRITLESAIEE